MQIVKESKNASRNTNPTIQKLFSDSFEKSNFVNLDVEPFNEKTKKVLMKIEECNEDEDQLYEKSLFKSRLSQENNYLSNINSTVSTTLDSLSHLELNKDSNQNTFKKKSNFYIKKEEKDLDLLLSNLYRERNDLIVSNIREIEKINKEFIINTITIFKNKAYNYLEDFRKRIDEHMMIEHNLKEEINLLNIKNIETNFIHVEDHQKIIDDYKFTSEMQKRIYCEKIKYYSTIVEEAKERQNNSYISNYDNTILNFTNSSILEKSVFRGFNQENSVDKRKFTEDAMYNSLVHKENCIVGNISNFKPKFLNK